MLTNYGLLITELFNDALRPGQPAALDENEIARRDDLT
jgi:hypothetical protein